MEATDALPDVATLEKRAYAVRLSKAELGRRCGVTREHASAVLNGRDKGSDRLIACMTEVISEVESGRLSTQAAPSDVGMSSETPAYPGATVTSPESGIYAVADLSGDPIGSVTRYRHTGASDDYTARAGRWSRTLPTLAGAVAALVLFRAEGTR